jgi:oxygen-independent coproporphyrinogen-3 oxidase
MPTCTAGGESHPERGGNLRRDRRGARAAASSRSASTSSTACPGRRSPGFSRTLDRVIDVSPDRVSIYNYAHLPSLFKPQRRILESDMPSADARLQILALAIRR